MFFDWFVHRLALLHADRHVWPVGQRVLMIVATSHDERLIHATLRGVIRATSPDRDCHAGKALVELDNPLRYNGHDQSDCIATVLAIPDRRWHCAIRLAIASSTVRLIDCDAAGNDRHARLIAIASMRLERNADP